MNLKVKKTIAREFLFVIVLCSLTLICFLFTYAYNSYLENKIEKTNILISSKTATVDGLSKINAKLEKQTWLHSQLLKEYDVSENPDYTKEKLWQTLSDLSQKDSIKIRWVSTWKDGPNNFKSFFNKIGFDNPENLMTFLDDNTINKADSSNIETYSALRNEIQKHKREKTKLDSKYLNYKEQKDFGIIVFFSLSTALFLFRYVYYGINWSVKTLKKKED